MNDMTHYASIIVASSGINDWERTFCASIIRKKMRGQPISPKQHIIMERIVRRFQDANMRADNDNERVIE